MDHFLPPIKRVTVNSEVLEGYFDAIRASGLFASPEPNDGLEAFDFDLEATQAHTLEANAAPEYLDAEVEGRRSPSEDRKNPNLVTWDGPDDPANPKNWSPFRKWSAILIVSAYSFIVSVSASMVAPALPSISVDLKIDSEVSGLLNLSIYVLALGIGPLLYGPLSEVYGRTKVLRYSNLCYLVFNLACGFAQTNEQMIALRFFSGLGGSAPLALGGGVIRDTCAPDQIGRGIGLYSLAPLLGPAIGPLIGGFIAESTTWRWMFYATTLADGMIQLVSLFITSETYAPKILGDKARRLREQTANKEFVTEWDKPNQGFLKLMGRNLIRPLRLLTTQPIVQVLSIFMAYLYANMFLVLSSFPRLWVTTYQEPLGISGLNYISLTLGLLVGSLTCGPLSDKGYKILARRNDGKKVPEYRCLLMVPASLLVPIGFFMYGWTAQAHTHWILPNIAGFLFSMGTILTFQCIQAYFIECYSLYAASAMAAAVMLRSVTGFGFPLFAPSMYDALGYGWGNSLLAFVALGIGIPGPLLLWKYGAKLREISPYAK